MLKYSLIATLALLFHFTSKWVEARATVDKPFKPSLMQFIADEPAKVLFTIVGSVLAFFLAYDINWIDPEFPGSGAVAAACGYMGSSIAVKVINQYQSGHK